MIDRFADITSHPLIEIISNETRLKILKLIASESNYGNRLAQILNLSTPAVHKHIKKLKENVLEISKRDKTSFSGNKGGESTHYKINLRSGLVFAVFPQYVHLNFYNYTKDDKIIQPTIIPDEVDAQLFGVEFKNADTTGKGDDNLGQKIKEIHTIEQQIISKENDLMRLLAEKNEAIEQAFSQIDLESALDYDERIILKSVVSYGISSLREISNLLSKSEEETLKIVLSLKQKGWIADKQIKPV